MTDEYALGVLEDLKAAFHKELQGLPKWVIRDSDFAFDMGMKAVRGEKIPKQQRFVAMHLLKGIKCMFKSKLSPTKDAENIDKALQKALVRLVGSDWDD